MSATGIILGGWALGSCALLSRAVFSPRSRLFGPVTWRGLQVDSSCIALTFDDGPDSEATPRVLDVLGECGAKAAFFLVGRNVEREAELVRRIDQEGHIIGNHSHSHANFGALRLSPYWTNEIRRTDDVIEQVIGKRPAMFRPPMGIKTPHIVRAARQSGHSIVTWSKRSLDGINTTAARIQARLEHKVRGGDIVLFHDGPAPRFRRDASAMIESLRPLILSWRERGLTIVRLEELLGVPATQPSKLAQ